MRFKKSFIKLCCLSVVANNLFKPSIASAEYLDNRYENISGENIKIDDVLESRDIDVEIEGNTLVNYADYTNVTYTNDNTVVNFDNKEILFQTKWVNNDSEYTDSNMFFNVDLEYGQTYTLVMNVLENTLTGRSYFQFLDNWENYVANEYAVIRGGDIDFIKSKFTVKENNNGKFKIYLRHFNNQEEKGHVKVKNIMILKGDWTNREIPNYFEGLMSVGQNRNGNHSIQISSQGILADIATSGDTNFKIGHIEKGKTYSLKINRADKNIRYNLKYDSIKYIENLHTPHFKDLNSDFVTFKSLRDDILYLNSWKPNYISEIMLVEGIYSNDTMPSYKPYTVSKKEILLNEPLRGLPNGIKDRVIKRKGQWVIERNVEEITLNGSENWYIDSDRNDNKTNYFRTHDFVIKNENFDTIYNHKTDFYLNNKYIQNAAQNNWYLIYSKSNLDVNRSKAISIREDKMSLSEFKNKLKNNPVTVVCQLITPYYESLNMESTVTLYDDITHISNNSTIPCEMSVAVDRALNIANKYVELAKTSPTIDNLSRARSWINLLDNSMVKEQLQAEINDISEITDLTFEKKNTTSNLDVYIKSENMLSLSLDTNSVVFDNFSGVEDMVKENAVNLTISSSLPYNLNAYLESEVQNTYKSEVMDKSMLNIKEGNENNYKTFDNIKTKLVLKDSCAKGNNVSHGIDLKLKGSKALETDTYKTVIKFEVEQV